MRPLLIILGWLAVWGTDCAAPVTGIPQTDTSKGFVIEDRSRQAVIEDMLARGHLLPRFKEWFASPEGNPGAAGSEADPFELNEALDGKRGISPGDILWLRGGTYNGAFTTRMNGTEKRPIHIRQFPGERALLVKDFAKRDTATLAVRGDHLWFWDFEVATSFKDRSRLDPHGKLSPWRGSGINVWGARTKYINMIVRDNGHGFGLWNEEGGTEIYGCLIFNNGNNKKEHGVYGHNRTGVHTIDANVIFNNAGYGLHLYANSTKSSVSGFDVAENSVFTNGAIVDVDQVADQILVGGVDGVPADRLTIRANRIFNFPEGSTSKNRGIRLGYEHQGNGRASVVDNYIVSRVPLRLLWWSDLEVVGNTIVSDSRSLDLEYVTEPNGYTFSGNRFVTGNRQSRFVVNGKKLTPASWSALGFATDDAVGQTAGESVIVVPNRYHEGRGTVTIFNPAGEAKVDVDPAGILKKGERYEVYDAQNVYAPAVHTGVYAGEPIRIAMPRSEPAQPVGNVERKPVHTAPHFAVYIICKRAK